MAAQDIIAIVLLGAAFLIGCSGKFYVRAFLVLTFIGQIARYFAYPNQAEDALWFIGAALATGIEIIAVIFGLFSGWSARWLCRRWATQRSKSEQN